MTHLMKRRLVVVVLSLVALIGVGAQAATALTGWTGFGSAGAVNRDEYGGVYITLWSETAKNPVNIQATLKGSATARRADISWSLDCSGPNGGYWYKSGMGTVTVSATQLWQPTWKAPKLGNPTYCELDVTADHFDQGSLNLSYRAQY